MGVDTVIISRHNLRTENVQKLADDLSQRLKINVRYGYQDLYNIDFRTGQELFTYELVELGKMEYQAATTNYYLNDCIYQVKEYVKQYGNDFPDIKELKMSKSLRGEMKEYIGNQHYEISSARHRCEYAGKIKNDTFHYEILTTRWGLFCNYFKARGNDDGTFKWLNKRRKELRHIVKEMGGSDVLYIPNQYETEDLAVDIYSWDGLMDEVNRRFGDSIIYISDFVRNKKILDQDEFPSVFYDDYADFGQEI